VGESFSEKETVFVRDVLADSVLAPRLDGVGGVRSATIVPLTARGECLGVLAVFFGGLYRPKEKLQKEQMRLLDAFAGQATLAVDTAGVRGRALDYARESDDYAREIEIVWEIGQAVASKLELHELVDTLAEKLKAAVGAKTCSVLVYDADSVGLKIMGHKALTRHHASSEHIDNCDKLAAMVAKQGEPLVLTNVPNSCHCKYPEMVFNEGTHHLLSVPMSLRGFVGAINVFRQNSEPFGEREKRLLMRVSPVVAAGIRNAELYERERRIAECLQQSFLPELAPELPGIEIRGLYQAAFDESRIGGDFYDVIDFGGGRYGVVVGDVAGKGLDAAVYTAMTRYMIQAYTAEGADPIDTITRLNWALHRYTPAHKFVTLVYGVIDTAAGTFTYVNAGHELPFIYIKEKGRLEELSTTGPAVGAFEEMEFSAETVPFTPGDTLVLYTDGASEARSDGKFLGTDGLREIVEAGIRKDVDDLPRAIVDGVRKYTDGPQHDDMAILAIKARKPGSLF
ncbi:MAG: SpoIIE family protein phosphatase, partial [Armatimonadota bacterium]